MVERFVQLSANEILIVQSGSFISIYDESLSFESVEEKALTLSNKIDKPIVFTSNFDDDVFICGIFRSGKLVACGKVGESLSVYGIDPEIMDVEKFCNELNINDISLIQSINTTDEISIIEDKIEQCLQVSLDLDISDVQSKPEHFGEVFNKNGIRIYKIL